MVLSILRHDRENEVNKQNISTPENASISQLISNTNKLAEKTRKNEEELDRKIESKFSYKTQYIANNTVVSSLDDVNLLVVDTDRGDVHIRLPPAAESVNKSIDIKKITDNTTFVVAVDSPDVFIEQISGGFAQTLAWNTARASYTLFCTGREWILI